MRLQKIPVIAGTKRNKFAAMLLAATAGQGKLYGPTISARVGQSLLGFLQRAKWRKAAVLSRHRLGEALVSPVHHHRILLSWLVPHATTSISTCAVETERWLYFLG
jgi:hypothetical protein